MYCGHRRRAHGAKLTPSEFASAYRSALTTATATATGLRVDRQGPRTHRAAPWRCRCACRRACSERCQRVHAADAGQRLAATRIAWSRSLAFPGLRPGEQLSRHTTLPRRATLLARDGTRAGRRRGAWKPASAPRRSARARAPWSARSARSRRAACTSWRAEGVPADAIVGVSGLELALDASLRGTPGGELLAGGQHSAASAGATRARLRDPKAASAVRTTVSPPVQRAAVTALGGSSAGSSRWSPPPGRSWPSPGSASTACSRRARRSR